MFDTRGDRNAFVMSNRYMWTVTSSGNTKLARRLDISILEHMAFDSLGRWHFVHRDHVIHRVSRPKPNLDFDAYEGRSGTIEMAHTHDDYSSLCIGRATIRHGQETELMCVGDVIQGTLSWRDLDRGQWIARYQSSDRNAKLDPYSIAMDRSGQWLVLDSRVQCVHVFDTVGTWRCKFGQDQLKHPECIAVDLDGRVLVGDDDKVYVFAFPL